MSTADLLRRAADRIEELAGKASHDVCPDWTYSAVRHIARNCEIECYHGGEEPDDGLDHDGWSRYDDAPWISTMGAQVAAPLVAWLRATVHEAEETELYANRPTEALAAAVELAHAVLGEES